MTDAGGSLLAMKQISIEFPGVKALTDVDFQTSGGRAHALIGANGAGKSTLMKVLAGAYGHYAGSISIDGRDVRIRTPKDAKDQGIQVVYQEVDTALIPNLTVGENIMLEKTVHDMSGRHWIGWKELHRTAAAILERMNVAIPPRKQVNQLTLAEKQMVLIARAISMKCRFLVLDEPTAPLSSHETEQLFRIVRHLKTEGVGIIFISHRLPELYEICEDITIMRDGKLVFHDAIKEIAQQEVVEYMLGTKLEGQFPDASRTAGEVCFEAKGIRDDNKVHGVDLHIRKGEIVGLAGLVGAGKTELCRALFGASSVRAGSIVLNGRQVALKSPYQAVRQGIALVPEERRREGIFVEETVAVNLSAANLSRVLGWGPWISRAKETSAAETMIRDLGVKTPSAEAKVRNLSGGNQQKIAIGKWLLADADVYIFDEPTKGVDVGAKRDIYDLIAKLAERGKGVLYASSEMSEMVGLTDRIYVMYDGTVVKELNTKQTSEEEILLYSTGGGTG